MSLNGLGEEGVGLPSRALSDPVKLLPAMAWCREGLLAERVGEVVGARKGHHARTGAHRQESAPGEPLGPDAAPGGETAPSSGQELGRGGGV